MKYKKRDTIELQIKWEGYDDPTWESFTHFVKETTPMVERYLNQKSLMKPLQVQAELEKRRKHMNKGDKKSDLYSLGGATALS